VFNERGSKFGAVAGVLRSPHASSGPHAERHSRHVVRAKGLVLILTLLAMGTIGCQNWFRPVTWTELGPREQKKPQSLFQVVGKKNMSVASLAPDDIVRIMQRVGFADEQILDLGTNLHNALRFSGAAEITYRRQKLAIFAIDGDYVRIQSHAGTFDYEISSHRFVSAPLTDR